MVVLHEDLHYLSMISLSRRDFEHLKGRLIEMFEEYNGAVAASLEEMGACLALDFFTV